MEYNYIFTKSKKKENDTGYNKIVITAIITAIVTCITQYFLQKNQLSSEQDYWKKRYTIENIDRINNTRLKLVEEINEGLLQLEVQAKEIKISSATVKYSRSVDDVKNLSALLVQYHKDLYRNASKVQLASMYFGNKVDSLIPKLGNALTKNFQKNMVKGETGGLDLPEFKLDFETTEDLSSTKKLFLESMLKEIEDSYKNQE